MVLICVSLRMNDTSCISLELTAHLYYLLWKTKQTCKSSPIVVWCWLTVQPTGSLFEMCALCCLLGFTGGIALSSLTLIACLMTCALVVSPAALVFKDYCNKVPRKRSLNPKTTQRCLKPEIRISRMGPSESCKGHLFHASS